MPRHVSKRTGNVQHCLRRNKNSIEPSAVRRRASCPSLAPEGPNPRPPDLAFSRAQLLAPPETVAAAAAGCALHQPEVGHLAHR